MEAFILFPSGLIAKTSAIQGAVGFDRIVSGEASVFSSWLVYLLVIQQPTIDDIVAVRTKDRIKLLSLGLVTLECLPDGFK